MGETRPGPWVRRWNAARDAMAATVAIMALGASDPALAASTLFDVAGPRDAGEALGTALPYTGAAVTFTLTQEVSNFAMAIDFECFSCAGTFYLSGGSLGPAASPLDLLAVTPMSTVQPATVFSGLTLGPGTYNAVAYVSSGFGIWAGSSAPAYSGNGSVLAGDDLALTSLYISLPTRSGFTAIDNDFRYTIFGDLAAASGVPEPASWALMIAGIGAIGGLSRRRSRTGPPKRLPT